MIASVTGSVRPHRALSTFLLTVVAMIAFAGNSLLCRAALRTTGIDASTFTAVRLISGAVVLWLIVTLRRGPNVAGSWPSAIALFAYAAAFSFAYLTLPAATGALLLFGAVQATMIGFGLARGERLRTVQWAGLFGAIAGLVLLLLPGLSAPPMTGAALMLLAGAAWGVYSLRGRGAGDPTSETAGNFLRAAGLALALAAMFWTSHSAPRNGVLLAIASGAIASGVGYAVWYSALRNLTPPIAATVQLSVPVLAAFGGVVLLGETFTSRLLAASIAILGGIALVVAGRKVLPRRV